MTVRSIQQNHWHKMNKQKTNTNKKPGQRVAFTQEFIMARNVSKCSCVRTRAIRVGTLRVLHLGLLPCYCPP